jgi:uncharacterized membrane protein YkgB
MTTDVMRHREAATVAEGASALEAAGLALVRWGLVLVLAWIGAMKFTAYEAAGIEPLLANSPLLRWTLPAFGLQAVSNLLGVVEIAVAILIALRPVSAALAAAGSALAVGMFCTTLTFLLSTPGWEPSLGGFPALSVVPGQFVLKDLVLLGASVWSLGESLRAAQR